MRIWPSLQSLLDMEEKENEVEIGRNCKGEGKKREQGMSRVRKDKDK